MSKQIECKFTQQPLDPKYFVGRDDLLDDFMRSGFGLDVDPSANRLAPVMGNLISLFGPQKIGRTSLLRRVQAIARLRGTGTRFEAAWENQTAAGVSPALAVYLDLRQIEVPARDGSSQTFVASVGGELRDFGDGIIDVAARRQIEIAIPDGNEALLHHILEITAPSVLLLVDRADLLLNRRVAEDFDALASLIASSSGRISVALAFGATEELSALATMERNKETQEITMTVSNLMGLKVEPPWTVPFLSDSAMRQFLSSSWYVQGSGEAASGPFQPSDIEWLLEMAGGHPFLLAILGRQSWTYLRCQAELTADVRRKIEDEATGEMQRLVTAVARRLHLESKSDLRSLIREVSRGSVLVRDYSTAASTILVNEGLAERANDQLVVRSTITRNLLANLADAEPHPKSSIASPTRPAGPSVAIQTESGEQIVQLTKIEAKILELLLGSTESTPVSANDFYATVWRESPSDWETRAWQQRLSQRLTTIRQKLRPYLGEGFIKNNYGGSYWLENQDVLSLREAA